MPPPDYSTFCIILIRDYPLKTVDVSVFLFISAIVVRKYSL